MSLTRITAVIIRQLLLLRRSIGRVMSIFFWSTVELFLWGFLTVFLVKAGLGAFNIVTVLLGALIFWNFFIRAQQNVSMGFLEDVWSRNLTNLFASPLTPGELILGLVAYGCLSTLITIALVAILAKILFAFSIFTFGFLLIPYITILLVFGLTLGIVTVAILIRWGPAAEVFSWAMAFSIQPFAAVFYPVETLPVWLQPMAKALPITHVFEGMRAVTLNGQLNAGELAAGASLALIYLAASVLLFLAALRAAKREGYLVHLSTESF